MAVPFRRVSKTTKRKRRTHQKLTAPQVTKCSECGEYIRQHRACSNCGKYKNMTVIEK